jgi:hypothetical protein
MVTTNKPAREAQRRNARLEHPVDERVRRHAEQEEAAGRANRDDARLGAELSAEGRPLAETETADSIKRAAENDGRV